VSLSLASPVTSFPSILPTITKSETEHQHRRAAIEEERAGVEDELNRMQEAERADREKRKQEMLAAGEADIAAARQEWEDALAQTKRKREEDDARVPERMKRPDIPELDEVADTAREKVDIPGTFNAMAVGPSIPTTCTTSPRWSRATRCRSATPRRGRPACCGWRRADRPSGGRS